MADETKWHRVSTCQDNSGCVEIHHEINGDVIMRNSAHPEQVLRFRRERWHAFIAAIVAGDYDPRPLPD